MHGDVRKLINVKDISDVFLYTRDDYLICYLSIGSINIDLLSEDEKQVLVQALAMSYSEDRKDFIHFSLPSQVNLDPIKEHLRNRYMNTEEKARRKGLNIMMKEIMYLSTSGTNFEHQHFMKIWKKVGTNIKDTKKELLVRVEEFRERYGAANISCELLKESEIIRMCNLFGNPQQSAYTNISDGQFYEMITQIG